MRDNRFVFEKLDVWHDAKQVAILIYKVTNTFPASEQYGLASQMKRSAVSVPSNLAEGTSRTSFKDQAHFSQIAYSSLMEVACQTVIAKDLGFLEEETYQQIRIAIQQLSARIAALRNSQKKRLQLKVEG